MKTKGTGIGLIVMLLLVVTASGQVLNPGFETADFSDWATFGQGWRTSGGGDAHTGDYGAVNDIRTNDVDTFRGIFQNVPVSAGESYDAGVYIRAVNLETSESWFELQWLDGSGGIISQLQTTHITNDQPFTLSALNDVIAPAGAVTASVRGIVFMPSPPTVDTEFQIFDDFFLNKVVDLAIVPVAPDSVSISWSTNAVGYQLEDTTNLIESLWSVMAVTPVVSGDQFVVTNLAAESSLNYRLQKH